MDSVIARGIKPMNKQLRSDQHPTVPATSQHLSDLLDEALDEGFPASDPVAIHVDPEEAAETAETSTQSKRPAG